MMWDLPPEDRRMSISMYDSIGRYVCVCAITYDRAFDRIDIDISHFITPGRATPPEMLALQDTKVQKSLRPQSLDALRSHVVSALRRTLGCDHRATGPDFITHDEAREVARDYLRRLLPRRS